MKTAIILGATGLVGSQLLKLLLENKDYSRVKTLVRRESGVKHPKLEEHVVDFDRPEDWAGLVIGDILFAAFGTTIKKAGSKEVQYKIDYHYQFLVARLAAENGVPDCVLVSSPGANPDSRIFYTRIKGELDRDVSKLGFDRFIIIQPSVLSGKRDEKRLGESVGIILGKLLLWLPGLKKYRPISGADVAKAMIVAGNTDIPMPITVYALEQLHILSKKY